MTALLLVLAPLFSSLVLLSGLGRSRATPLLLGSALLTTALSLGTALDPTTAPMLGGLFRADATSRLFLAVINPIFLGVSVYVWSRAVEAPVLRPQLPRLAGLSLAFLAFANASLLANHLLLIWVAIEATTLVATPMVLRPGVASSRQAAFRYLLFSSIGLGLTLLGFLSLGRGMEHDGFAPTFFLERLPEYAQHAPNAFTKLGLALTILGFGTKLGLAPMYSWLPEVYDEAPPAVAALLGAVQFNCALVGLFRVVELYRPTHGALVSAELLTMGIASMAVSTVSVVATRNLNRLIAYASINHAGVIAIGLGIGKSAAHGLLLYVLSNAFIKAILFLTAGNVSAHYGTRDTRKITGLLNDLPYSGVFLMVGTFALLGFPPFGSFLGELLILSALVTGGQLLVFAAFCVLITMTFAATGRTIFPMIWSAPAEKRSWPRQTFLSASPKIVFLVALVVLGIYVPPSVEGLIEQVAAALVGP